MASWNETNVTSFSSNSLPHFPHFVLPYYQYENSSSSDFSPVLRPFFVENPSRGTSWSTTLIVVVAVSAYVALAILVCLIYKCLKQRAIRGPVCPRISCPNLPCFSGQCTGICPPACVAHLQSLWKKCCPTKMPNCQKLVTCHGMNMDCSLFDKCKLKDGCKWLPTWKTSLPKVPVWLKTYCANACCCCFQNGNCRFLCLECKVRTDNDGHKGQTAEGRQVTPNGDQAHNMGPYPFYPSMGYPYVNTQPGGPAWSTTASATPPVQPLGPYPSAISTYQPISFLNQQYSWARPVGPLGPPGSPFLPHSPSPQPFQYSPSPFALRPPLQPLAHTLANATTHDAERAAQALINAISIPSTSTA
ncbi:hypothetical protein RvY_13513 [Ramazzottius varieornatus]|uniref:Uncharacterized protein n=1 Tax=Ramazzottius varieornatus TaxID=947166 RepID=A0A1D1VVL0_RAMVA|nr:hypothetical protein RvY_13513 [Ramazzottius varieornatus]